MSWETVVGLEVHVQLSTRTKLFCSCPVAFGAPPNTNVCPVCLGMPGVLPVLNREAVARATRAALALGCEVGPRAKFDRKSYCYPDLPKNYQISQYDDPLGRNGALQFGPGDRRRTVRIRRVHMEEDAGKLVHSPDGRASLVDLNRTGVPLVEIVSEPDVRSGAEARAYLEELRRVLRYTAVSDCNMEEGSMRCEPNVSVRRAGTTELGTKTEVKNLNSLRAVEEAVDYEAARHVQVLESGRTVLQETMLWDAERGRTRAMRTKEEAHDYRYFPEPDLPPLLVPVGWLDKERARVGELPAAKRERYAKTLGLSEYDIGVLTAEKDLADYFERLAGLGIAPKTAANWVTQDLLRAAGERKLGIDGLGLPPEAVAGMIGLVEARVIDQTIARDRVLPRMLDLAARGAANGTGPVGGGRGDGKAAPPGESGSYDLGGREVRPSDLARAVVESEGLAMVSDTAELEAIAERIVEENPKPMQDVKKNPRAAMKYIGMVRKASGGKADAMAVKEIIRRIVKARTGLDLEI